MTVTELVVAYKRSTNHERKNLLITEIIKRLRSKVTTLACRTNLPQIEKERLIEDCLSTRLLYLIERFQPKKSSFVTLYYLHLQSEVGTRQRKALAQKHQPYSWTRVVGKRKNKSCFLPKAVAPLGVPLSLDRESTLSDNPDRQHATLGEKVSTKDLWKEIKYKIDFKSLLEVLPDRERRFLSYIDKGDNQREAFKQCGITRKEAKESLLGTIRQNPIVQELLLV